MAGEVRAGDVKKLASPAPGPFDKRASSIHSTVVLHMNETIFPLDPSLPKIG